MDGWMGGSKSKFKDFAYSNQKEEKKLIKTSFGPFFESGGGMDGWVGDGGMSGWMVVKVVLRINYSNQK